jgi:hypothetical protein
VSNIDSAGAAAARPAPAVAGAPGSLGMAVVAGLVAMLAGAVLWAVITVTTEYQIGFMAIGVGFLVGWAVRRFGQGTTQAFALTGAVLALLGCLLGNLFTVIGFLSKQEAMPLADVAGFVLGNPSMAVMFMRESFSPMDLLFYAIAVYEGYKIAVKPAAAAEGG